VARRPFPSRLGVGVVLVLATGCGRAPAPAARPGALVTRLAPRLGGASEWLMGAEQAPSVLLKAGAVRTVPLSAVENSRLRFGLATARGAPRQGTLELEVRADGRLLDTIRVPARKASAWRPVSLALPNGVTRELEFHTRLLPGAGQPPLPARAGRAHPWVALGAPRVVAPVDPAQRKVLIWISVDTLRADHLGAYGYARPTSPAIDRFLRTAVRFTDAFSAASWTLPSLAAQFTSRPPSFHGAVAESRKRDPLNATVFEALAEHGFTVLGVTSNTFVSPKFETASGFDTLWDTDGDAAEVTRLALAALERWDGGHLALFVHYMDPHAYYEPPPPFLGLFQESYRGPVTTRNFEEQKGADAAGIRFLQGRYDGEIAFTDAKIADLLSGLAARGLLEGSVVVFSADHGEEFQEHGGWSHGHTLYQEMLHVPLGLRVPGLGPQVVAEPVSAIDLAPTLLEAFGIPPPASFQGRSLMPRLRGATLGARTLIAETERTLDGTRRLCLRQGRFKYVRVMRAGADDAAVSDALYDILADPQERRPIVAPERETLRREAAAYLDRARAEARAALPSELSPEDRERLRALGYLK
jgi:arylsulfatase A-like enzyme